MRTRFKTALTLFALGLVASTTPTLGQDKPLRTIEGGVLDEIVLYVDKLPDTKRVTIKAFSATDAELTEGDKSKEETAKMLSEAPGLLSAAFVSKMKEVGPFSEVSDAAGDAASADGLVVEGKFIEMDPGSRAKRYFVGFGAGKSGVTVKGTLRSGDKVLATFSQRRIGAMGAFGGDSMAKLRADSKDIGEDIAKFLNAWSTGKKLK